MSIFLKEIIKQEELIIQEITTDKQVKENKTIMTTMMEELERFSIPMIYRCSQGGIGKIDFEKEVKAISERKGNLLLLLANGEIIGFITLMPSSEYSEGKKAKDIFLSQFFIVEKWRGKGYGKKFLKITEKFATEKGYRTFLVRVLEKNKVAVDLYEKSGFKTSSRVMIKKL